MWRVTEQYSCTGWRLGTLNFHIESTEDKNLFFMWLLKVSKIQHLKDDSTTSRKSPAVKFRSLKCWNYGHRDIKFRSTRKDCKCYLYLQIQRKGLEQWHDYCLTKEISQILQRYCTMSSYALNIILSVGCAGLVSYCNLWRLQFLNYPMKEMCTDLTDSLKNWN